MVVTIALLRPPDSHCKGMSELLKNRKAHRKGIGKGAGCSMCKPWLQFPASPEKDAAPRRVLSALPGRN